MGLCSIGNYQHHLYNLRPQSYPHPKTAEHLAYHRVVALLGLAHLPLLPKGDTTTAWVLFFLPFIIALLLVSGVLLALGLTH